MNKNVLNIAKMGIVAGIYILLGFLTMPLNFGPLQFRLPETANAMSVFNKRYILSLCVGCFGVNMFTSLNTLDLVIGTLNTLVIAGVSYWISRYIKNYWAKLWVVPFVGAFSMFMIAFELNIIAKYPFWITYGSLALSEFITCSIGVIIFGSVEKALPEKYKLSK